MDNATRFIDTIQLVSNELTDLKKHITHLNNVITRISQDLPKGDIRDKQSRIDKISDVKVIIDELQSFIIYTVNMQIGEHHGSLEAFHSMIDEKEDEVWVIRETYEELSAPQTVDRLTDAIADYLVAHKDDPHPPKSLFVDNPDNFVADFVNNYLDHPITDRMSDMVISLVTDWISFRLS